MLGMLGEFSLFMLLIEHANFEDWCPYSLVFRIKKVKHLRVNGLMSFCLTYSCMSSKWTYSMIKKNLFFR